MKKYIMDDYKCEKCGKIYHSKNLFKNVVDKKNKELLSVCKNCYSELSENEELIVVGGYHE